MRILGVLRLLDSLPPRARQSSVRVTSRLSQHSVRMVHTSTKKLAEIKRHARLVVRRLAREYPEAECSLAHVDPLQLLVATILSAQCTDERVNMVTPALFRRWPDAAAFADAKLTDLEEAIRSTGFYRNKARNIQACCRELVEQYGGKVPQELDQLVTLPGVGRKTANVVLGVAFGKAVGVVVDTHVTRLSRRMGLSQSSTPEKIEQDLMAVIPRDQWIAMSHRMIFHGRKICLARKPRCQACVLEDVCPRIGVADATPAARSKRRVAAR